MLTHYLVLDLPPDAGDQAIRQRYLELVKTHTPEADPVRFRRITTAYEAIKDERRRLTAALFESLEQPDYEQALYRLAEARGPKRKRIGLKDMIKAAEKQC